MDNSLHLALVGKTTALAAAELATVLQRYSATIKEFNPPHIYEINGPIDPSLLLSQLGGTVKILKPETLPPAEILLQTHQDHFCLSSLTHRSNLLQLATEIKHTLTKQGLHPHFRLLSDPFSSAGITTKYTEFCLIPHNGSTVVAQTVAVQSLYHWTQKDYHRPAFDPSSGMLPPKVARMMVNLAIPQPLQPHLRVYDPMCGSGTILNEMLDLNLTAIGSDYSPKAVHDSQLNTSWFKTQFNSTTSATVFQADATHVTLNQLGQPVDAIVFEGYLGPPHPKEDQISNLIKGLQKLYKGVFKNLYPLLKLHSRLVCALPEYHTSTGVKNLDSLVDWAATQGYTQLNRFIYGRPHAFVKRAIYVLQKTGK